MGTFVASDMNSSMSTTCVQLASLQSRTPNCAESARPLAQMPLNPASSTMRALRPLCASIKNSSSRDVRSLRSVAVFDRSAMSFQLTNLKARQDFVARFSYIIGKIDLDPGQPRHVFVAELLRVREQHVAYRFLVRLEHGARANVTVGRSCEPARNFGCETKETDRFATQIELDVHLLAKLDEAAAAQADLHRFVSRLELAVEQQDVAVGRRAEPVHDTLVVQHVGVHQQHTGIEMIAHRPQRNHASLFVSGIQNRRDDHVARDARDE